MNALALPPRPRILVIALRRLGDVLLTTPLVRSLRRGYVDSTIDVLVFSDTAGVLDGNPDIDRIVTMPPSPTPAQTFEIAAQLVRRYDLAVSTQSGDRPSGFAILAGRRSIAPVENRLSGHIKRFLLTRSVAHDRRAHRVEALLRIADVLGIARVAEVVPPRRRLPADMPKTAYAVVHAAPMFHYKRWTVDGWRGLAKVLVARGLTVVATGGPATAERAYLDAVWRGAPVVRRDGQLDWGELAGLIGESRVFVGPDTSVTHLAAATGCPTVALYGPTDPRLWAPWPSGGLNSPWAATGAMQTRGNVRLVQHAFACTPCQLEGCERCLESYSACLDELSLDEVMRAVDDALSSQPLARAN
jgi:heptosyltransferase-3